MPMNVPYGYGQQVNNPMQYGMQQYPQMTYPQNQPNMQGMPQMQQQMPQQPVQHTQQDQKQQLMIHGFDWVLGKDGANSYYVPPGKTFLLFDATPDSNMFFLKTNDYSGRPLPPIAFDYSEHKEETQKPAPEIDMSKYVPVEQFETLKKEFTALKSKPQAKTLTADDVKEIFEQMIEQKFARPSETTRTTKKGDKT